MRKTSLLAALLLAGTSIVAMGQGRPVDNRPAAPAIAAPPPPRDLAPPLEDLTKQPSPIPGLTDKLGVDEKKTSELLGEEFESQAAGISFRPPADCKPARSRDIDKIVEYSNDDRHWLLKVTRARLGQPMTLQTVKVQNQDPKGLLDITVDEVMKTQPTPTIMRQEIVNVGENAVGLAFFHVTLGSDRYLRQQAIFQSNEQLYYIFNLTTPSPKNGNAENDPEERLAARTFMAMIDSIQLLDRAWIKTDQVNRLFRTRALFTDWNDKEGAKIRDAIVPEQWLRIVRNGKDIGYSYQVEEFVEGKNVKNNPGRLRDGVLISVRTRTIDGNNQVDLGLQMFSSFDRRHEDWAQIMNMVANKGQAAEDKRQNMEFGFSEIQISRVLDKEARRDPNTELKDFDPNLRDLKNPILRNVETYALGVDRATQGQNNKNKSEQYKPSPWYIPQAVGAMLPRLLPLNRPVTYMFQSYVSDQQAVIMRYVDVGFEKMVNINGQHVRAVPITDRIRLEGIPTIHYMSLEGKYLGSVNEELKLEILPTDKATIEKMWTNPDLTRPQIERPAEVGVR